MAITVALLLLVLSVVRHQSVDHESLFFLSCLPFYNCDLPSSLILSPFVYLSSPDRSPFGMHVRFACCGLLRFYTYDRLFSNFDGDYSYIVQSTDCAEQLFARVPLSFCRYRRGCSYFVLCPHDIDFEPYVYSRRPLPAFGLIRSTVPPFPPL